MYVCLSVCNEIANSQTYTELVFGTDLESTLIRPSRVDLKFLVKFTTYVNLSWVDLKQFFKAQTESTRKNRVGANHYPWPRLFKSFIQSIKVNQKSLLHKQTFWSFNPIGNAPKGNDRGSRGFTSWLAQRAIYFINYFNSIHIYTRISTRGQLQNFLRLLERGRLLCVGQRLSKWKLYLPLPNSTTRQV